MMCDFFVVAERRRSMQTKERVWDANGSPVGEIYTRDAEDLVTFDLAGRNRRGQLQLADFVYTVEGAMRDLLRLRDGTAGAW